MVVVVLAVAVAAVGVGVVAVGGLRGALHQGLAAAPQGLAAQQPHSMLITTTLLPLGLVVRGVRVVQQQQVEEVEVRVCLLAEV